jgi:hypothetical protein
MPSGWRAHDPFAAWCGETLPDSARDVAVCGFMRRNGSQMWFRVGHLWPCAEKRFSDVVQGRTFVALCGETRPDSGRDVAVCGLVRRNVR